jgi:tetratricopeptide (TPR) repeat protein
MKQEAPQEAADYVHSDLQGQGGFTIQLIRAGHTVAAKSDDGRASRVNLQSLASNRPWPSRFATSVLAVATLAACSGGSAGGKPPTVTSLLNAGIAAQQQGRVDAARQLFEQVLAKDPGNVYAHYDLGVIAQGANDKQTALHEYGAALVANPRYVPALFNEATIWAATDPSLAMATYRQIVQLQPQAPTAYLNLGLLEVKAGQRAAGVRDLNTALHQDPTLATGVPKKLRTQVGRYANQHASPTPSSSS